MRVSDAAYQALLDTRARRPEAVAEAYAYRRRRPALFGDGDTLFLIAADHPARGALAVHDDPLAMADRRGLLDRLSTALDHPAVDGLLATPDVVEDLLLLGGGLLDGKIVIGSMNRGGLAGASWELDDPFTAYDAASIVERRLDGGKMLLRLDNRDAGTVPTIAACARAVSELAAAGVMALVEPLPYTKDAAGHAVLDRDPAALVRAATVAAGLGTTSAHTWLKLPAVPEAAAATALPALVLGGAPSRDPADDLKAWGAALRRPEVRGLVVGRALLYPPDGDVAAVVDAAAQVLATCGSFATPAGANEPQEEVQR
jgi:hypothetical protein